MKIKVFCDNKKVFEGYSHEFLAINEFDKDLVEMIDILKGHKKLAIEQLFFSGCWRI